MKYEKLLKEIQPDIIATHSSKAGIIGRIVGGHFEFQLYLPHMVGHLQMEFLHKRKESINSFEKIIGRISDGVITVSEYDQ